jgi:K+/H+ antiporter YhaU regulatory subunit KhtT
MSLSTLGANAIVHYLSNHQTALLAEGLNVFRADVSSSLVGKKLADSGIREKTECSVAAIDQDGTMTVNPDPSLVLSAGAKLVIIGSHQGEKAFLETFAAG